MNKILMLTCGMLMVFSVALAEETTPETCANGAGTVVTGTVTEHKYCMSNETMNWWNAHAWCEGLKSRLFDLDLKNCGCNNATINCKASCPDLAFGGTDTWVWTSVPYSTEQAYDVHFKYGAVHPENNRGDIRRALCY